MDSLIKVNKYQTELTEDLKKELPKYVWDNVLEYISQVKFIQNLISPNREYIKDRPVMTYTNDKGEEVPYEDGRKLIDLTNPHILEDLDFFRERAIFFEKNGKYTNIIPNGNPNSDYAKFWKEELRRWKYGLVRPDGEWIPGELYFYWNYTVIWLVEKDKVSKLGNKGERRQAFPKPWLGDYLFHHYIYRAKELGKHCKMLKARGIGAEQPNSELVKTVNGDVKVGDVRVGDKLIGIDGEETVVKEIFPQGLKDVYEVELIDGRKVKCGLDHLWYVNDLTKKRINVVKTSEMIDKGLYWNVNKGKNKMYKFKIPKQNCINYSEKELPIDPYVLGVLLGDGTLTTTTLKIATDDSFIVEEFERLLPGYELNKDKSNNNYLINTKTRFDATEKEIKKYKNAQYGLNKLKREIENLKLDVGCFKKFIPDIYKRSSKEQRFSLLQGLMDSDGSVNEGGSKEFSNSNYRLIKDVADVARSLGYRCKLSKGRPERSEVKFGKECNLKQEYRLHIITNDEIFRLPRKVKRCKLRKIYTEYAIVNIKKLGYKEESTCFFVDNETHTYLTRDFIPTHNSFKAASWSPRNMYVHPGSGNPNFHLASDKGFLTGDKGIWGKVLDTLDWIADHTPFPKIRSVDRRQGVLEVQLGYDDEYGVRRGLQSSVHGISLKDNPDKARGIRGPLIHYEEDGLFPDLEKAWGVNRRAVEDGGVAFGTQIAMGCLTENNYVWNNYGELIKISELVKEDGIIGFNYRYQEFSRENITYWQPPTKKECVRITTNTGRTLECSTDHPILWSHKFKHRSMELNLLNGKRRRLRYKKVEFKEACKIKVGDQVATINEVPIFSAREMWEPRLIGWLVGDGSYGFDKTPVLSNCDKYINDYVHKNLDYTTEKTYITKDGRVYEENRIKGICGKLRELEIYGQTRDKKRLPKDIHSYSKYSITEFIGGFFDADGSVDKEGAISITSGHKEILLELQLLLQKLGIHGSLYFKPPRKNNPIDKNGWYEFEIKDKSSCMNFYKHIKFKVGYKQERLDKFPDFYKNKRSRNASHLPGMRFERVVDIESIGKQPVYNLTAGTTHTYVGNGIITHNTGGTMGRSFEGSEKLFYSPGAYNIYGIPNVFDKNANGETECGFFWSAYLSRNGCYDAKSGEPDVIKAIIEVEQERFKIRNSSSDANALTQAKSENPITPQEAVMRSEGTVFPVADLKDYLETIMVKKDSFLAEHYVGELVYNPLGKVEWRPNSDLHPLHKYDIGSGDRTGALEIFEMPRENAEGRIQYGRYLAGIDPVDSETGPSLFSMIVMDSFTDRIVAEYTGRPRLVKDAYEIALRLCMFYNATANYEQNLKGLFSYFEQKNALHYLCDVPQILKDMDMVNATNLYGNKAKGSRANKQVNAWGRALQAEWMLQRVNPNDDEDTRLKMHTLRSLAYIEEAIKWNEDGNFDRVSAAGMLFILREDRYKMIQSNKNRQETRIKELSNDAFFNKNYDSNYNNGNQQVENEAF